MNYELRVTQVSADLKYLALVVRIMLDNIAVSLNNRDTTQRNYHSEYSRSPSKGLANR